MSLLDLVSGQMNAGTIGSLAQALGASPDSTQSAVTAALPILVGAMGQNAQQPGGAASLLSALSGHGGGDMLSSLGGLLGQQSHSDTGNGILGHLLGGQRNQVETAVAQSSGLDASKVAALLPMLAPVVMNMLAKKTSQDGLDAGGLASMLGQDHARVQQQAPNLLTMLLDKNGDGNITGEAMQMGMGLLGKLFK
jgi:hypothetical protein